MQLVEMGLWWWSCGWSMVDIAVAEYAKAEQASHVLCACMFHRYDFTILSHETAVAGRFAICARI